MRVIDSVAELQATSRAWKGRGGVVALVPTMGALHQGHLSLVRAARRGDGQRLVIVSVFVNPLQFRPGEDFERYPKPFADDRCLLEEEGVDILFHPAVEEMFPNDAGTRVVPGPVAERLEGMRRPGHFAGVCTVVARLFGVSLADDVYFGQKDAQQAAVIRGMIRDLALPIRTFAVCPTVRETDGLAMSSRNRYLDRAGRRAAALLVQALAETQRRYRAGEREPGRMSAAMLEALGKHSLITPDYAEVVDPETFQPATTIEASSLAVVAAQVGSTRLIDNGLPAAADLLPYLTVSRTEVSAWKD